MIVIALLVPLSLLVRDQARNRALEDGQKTARSVAAGLAVASSLSGGWDPAVVELVVATAGDDTTSVFLPSGEVVGVPAGRSAALDAAFGGRALTADAAGGVEILAPVTGAGETLVVRTFVTDDALTEGVFGAIAALVLLGVVLIAAGVLVADRLGRNLVEPVSALADAAGKMAEGDLTVRVDPAGPQEIADVGGAFNRLADRVDELIVDERESLADLSHALRTPLTALRLQAEMLEQEDASRSMLEDLDRLSSQVDGLIAEARRRSPTAGTRDADLAAVVRERYEFWSVLAEEQGRQHDADIPEGPLPVRLTDAEAAAAMDTVLENVFSHTEPGTTYRVRVFEDGPRATVIVEDDGPGFPRRPVLARGASGAGSTGLGLDIVRRAAERSGGGVTLETARSGGARIEISFDRV
jgi:signal transduction histidine kinase